jgi:hypothetical protein
MAERELLASIGTWPDEGNLPKRLLGEDAELEGEVGEEDRSVHITQMV